MHEDGWAHRPLGSRNVRQADIKDIRYETPLCFTLFPTCPRDINCGPARTPHSQERSSKETPGTGVLSIKCTLTDDCSCFLKIPHSSFIGLLACDWKVSLILDTDMYYSQVLSSEIKQVLMTCNSTAVF